MRETDELSGGDGGESVDIGELSFSQSSEDGKPGCLGAVEKSQERQDKPTQRTNGSILDVGMRWSTGEQSSDHAKGVGCAN